MPPPLPDPPPEPLPFDELAVTSLWVFAVMVAASVALTSNAPPVSWTAALPTVADAPPLTWLNETAPAIACAPELPPLDNVAPKTMVAVMVAMSCADTVTPLAAATSGEVVCGNVLV